MGKAAGVSRRRRKNQKPKFPNKAKLRKQKEKLTKRAKLAKIECKTIRNAWDTTKSVKRNLADMGLAADANKALKITKPYSENMQIEMGRKNLSTKKKWKSETTSNLKKKIAKPEVLEQLIEEASKPRAKRFKFGTETVKFCVYLIEKYGEDYEAMARDPRNYYQESAGQIRQKIKRFKSIPTNYNAYLKCIESIENETEDT